VNRSAKSISVVGVDIGQKRDPTAVAVVEIEYRYAVKLEGNEPRRESHYLVRCLERMALGTPYPQVARRIGEISRAVHGLTGRGPNIFVDATGVGQPIVDILKESSPVSCVWAVYFTHGDRRIENREDRTLSLGKAFLVSRLQTLLQFGRLHLPGTPDAEVLAEELLDYEIRVDESANERYGAFKVGRHDDLVTALGLAVHKEPVVSVYPGDL
jgi:hypothetical protein